MNGTFLENLHLNAKKAHLKHFTKLDEFGDEF